jgi:hypothetical protein
LYRFNALKRRRRGGDMRKRAVERESEREERREIGEES